MTDVEELCADIAHGSSGDQPFDWGRESRMSAFETMIWRVEVDARLRSTITIVDLLDSVPDTDRLVAAHDWATRVVPRFRQRVVEPALPVGPAVWSTDPNFDLRYHLRRVQLTPPGSLRQLLDLAEQVAMTPFDRARPPWEATLVEGLEGGRAGYLLKLHHSATDGLGGIQLLSLLHSRTREPDPDKPQPPAAEPESLTPERLLGDELTELARSVPGTVADGISRAAGWLSRALLHPDRVIGDTVRYAESVRRVLAPPAAPRSPLLNATSLSRRFVALDVPLADLKAAAKAAGGSLNDGFVAALLGAFRRYHDHFGVALAEMPIAMPISLRTADDLMGGNRFTGARFAAPVGEVDPRARIAAVRQLVLSARDEPAVNLSGALSPVLSRLPTGVLTELARQFASGHDLQASNVPGIAHPVYLAGARITHMFPFGPVPGCAAMAALLSHNGTCCIGVAVDSAAITDVGVFAECLRAGFDEVLALGDGNGVAADMVGTIEPGELI